MFGAGSDPVRQVYVVQVVAGSYRLCSRCELCELSSVTVLNLFNVRAGLPGAHISRDAKKLSIIILNIIIFNFDTV